MSKLTESDIWKELKNHKSEISKISLKELFKNDTERFDKFSIQFDDILLDYSKNIIDIETITLLNRLATESNLENEIRRMFSGDIINFTEKRAVLHTALRNFSDKPVLVDGIDVMPQIISVLAHIKEFSNDIHSGKFLGYTGRKITDVVNIGIGGSDLGPAMVCRALQKFAVDGMNVHFVSNVDASHLLETLKKLSPETTLFVIASKTFTTQETKANAETAKEWFLSKTDNNISYISKHFIALSTNRKAVTEFGIDPQNMFEFWDWVGGRYSLWSAIGMSIALYVGYDNFEKLLYGAYKMDRHFEETPYHKNLPVIMAMLGIWYSNFFDAKSHAVIPYEQYLEFLPDFLQQLDMESNGKYIDRDSQRIDYTTGPIIWGKPGTNAQHSFFQLIHQGTQMIPADFIAFAEASSGNKKHHDILISNFIAQTEALMKGKTYEEAKEELLKNDADLNEIEFLIPHKIFEGNKPTNTIFIKKLTPENLGSIIALYEHKVFVQGVIWNINSFDQWGVELGKQLAGTIHSELKDDSISHSHDTSTNGLINHYKQNR